MGKTSIMLATYTMLKKRNLVNKMLVIAPLRPCYLTWPAEVAKWKEFSHLRVGILHGKSKEEVLDDDSYDIYAINPEGLEWLYDKLREKRNFWPWEMLVVDESTKFKHTNTKRFKLLKPMLPNFHRRYILTGTFSPNGLMDIFGQAFILDQGAALGRFITHFRNRFFFPTGYGGYDWQPIDGADEKIMATIKPMVLRMSAEDWLEMPTKLDNIIYVDLPKKARSKYDELEDDFFIRLDKGDVDAINAAALTIKLRQFCNGAIYINESNEDYEEVHDAKVEALVDLVEELNGKPLLVGYEFNHDYERIYKAFKGGVPKLGSGTSRKEEAAIVAAWNRGEIPVLAANPASAALGLNLQERAQTVCWFGLTWNLEHYIQFVDRVYRQGVTGNVVVHHILARDTIDVGVYQRLLGKEKSQRGVMDAVRKYRKSKN